MAQSETESKSSGNLDHSNCLVQESNPSNTNTNSPLDPEPIDFDECLKDSPKFRQTLKDNLSSIENLENSMVKAIKHISNYIETGRDHIKSQKDLINSMRSLNSALGPNQRETKKRVAELLDNLEEIPRINEIVLDQSAKTVRSSLTNFINDDLFKLREARKSFDKISHEHDQALLKYSQPVKKQQEDSENLLIATSTAFTHTSLDLSIQLTTLQSKKGCDILASLLLFSRAYGTFFHQGYDIFEDFKPRFDSMDEYLSKIEDEYEILTRNLPSKHLMVSNNELKPLSFDNKAQQVHLEGYLFKKASNGFKVWNRRWFILKDHKLVYMKRGDPQPIVMEEDLRLLTVRQVDNADNERRFCFEIVSPHKSHILQADCESSCKTWILAIQAGVNAAFHDTENEKSLSSIDSANNSSTATQGSRPTINQTTSSGLKQNGNPSVSNTGGWGSSFSLKALQQQATNRLSSITGGDSKDNSSKSKQKKCSASSETNLPDESTADDQLDGELIVDGLGRSYTLLSHHDEDDETEEENDVAKYPKPANKLHETGTTMAIPCAFGLDNDGKTGSERPPEKPQRAYMIILKMPGNEVCADCGATEPKWASINLGITLCIECAGIHRSLGVHLSKVRSLTLDTEVWSPQIVHLMLSLGNNSVNSSYLSCYRGQMPKITPESSREERENWIKTKYLLKSFMRPPEVKLNDSVLSNDVKEPEADTQSTRSPDGASTSDCDCDEKGDPLDADTPTTAPSQAV